MQTNEFGTSEMSLSTAGALPPIDPKSNNQPDAELLALFTESGCRNSLEPLVYRYSGLVYSVVSRVVYQAQDREDACQATFLSLVKSAKQIKQQKSIASWLYTAAFRIALRLRQRSRSKVTSLSANELQMIEQSLPDPLASITQDIEHEKLNQELQLLPQELRDPLIEHYFLGLTAPQIAERMDLSISAVEGRLRRGKQRLRTAMAKRGIGLSLVLAGASSMSPPSAAAMDRVWDLCVKAVHVDWSLAMEALDVGQGADLIPSSGSHLMNSQVLSLVQGEMAMSIGLTKILSGLAIGMCSLAAVTTVASWMSPAEHGQRPSAMLLAASHAGETDIGDGNAPFEGSPPNAGGAAASKEGASLGGGFPPVGVAVGSGEGLVGSGPGMSREIGGSEGDAKWMQRGEAANKKISQIQELLGGDVDIGLLNEPASLLNTIVDLANVPVIASKSFLESGMSLDALAPVESNRVLFGSKKSMPAKDLLELMLSCNSNVDYVVYPNRIELVESSDLQSKNDIRFYNVSSVLKHNTETERHNMAQLIADYVLLQDHEDQGGSAKVSVVGVTMIVACSESKHRNVEMFLSKMKLIEDGVAEVSNGSKLRGDAGYYGAPGGFGGSAGGMDMGGGGMH